MPSSGGSRAGRLAGVGVVTHLVRPTVEQCVRAARLSEESGADWCVLPDVLGWPDVWMALGAAARATSRILLGPGVTNPYTRHPLATAACLATLEAMSGGRAILGVGAGGTELRTAAGMDRSDAPARVADLVRVVRRAAEGRAPVPFALPVPDAPVLGGARGRRMVEAVAGCCDAVLLWGLAHGDLAAAARRVAARGTRVAWSPLRPADGPWLPMALVYGVLNSPPPTRRRLGVGPDLEAALRRALAEGGVDRAASLVPAEVLPEFTVGDDPEGAAAVARRLGATAIVVQAFDLSLLPDRVAWAREVAGRLLAGIRAEGAP